MESDFEAARRAARRSYELGRLGRALTHAALATVLVGLVGGALFGERVLGWLGLTFLIVTVTEWRGVYLMKGARRGLVAGFVAMILPLSVLRPCCGIDAKAMGVDCCVMPSVCWLAGAVVGLGVALFLPRAPDGRRLEAGAGMLLGIFSVAVPRCSVLFLGETLGLLGGVALGLVAVASARALARPSPT